MYWIWTNLQSILAFNVLSHIHIFHEYLTILLRMGTPTWAFSSLPGVYCYYQVNILVWILNYAWGWKDSSKLRRLPANLWSLNLTFVYTLLVSTLKIVTNHKLKYIWQNKHWLFKKLSLYSYIRCYKHWLFKKPSLYSYIRCYKQLAG